MATQFQLDFTTKLSPAAQAAKEDGMARSEENASHFWKVMISAAIVAVARRQAELTVDDVLDEMEKIPNCPETHALHALGPAMKRASKDGIISPTNVLVRSKREIKHGNRRTVWKSNYFQVSGVGSS